MHLESFAAAMGRGRPSTQGCIVRGHIDSNTRISSGNAKLDVMCGGGFYRDSIILVSGATGTGKTLTVTTFLSGGCKRGEKTLLFAFEESREQLLRSAVGWDMDFRKWEKMGLLNIACRTAESMSLEDHLAAMKREIESFSPARIAVDSLSAMERISSIQDVRQYVVDLASQIKAKRMAGLLTATTASLMGEPSLAEKHLWAMADTIILLRYVELMGEVRRGLAVLKMRGSWHDRCFREYEIDGYGMHLTTPFYDVVGILAGTPVRYSSTEEKRRDDILHQNVPES